MASNPLRIRNKFGRDINIICGAATDEPVSPRTVLPSSNAIRTSIPERRRVGNPLPPWQPQGLRLPFPQPPPSHRSPIQLPPLYTHDPYSAPDMRDPLSSASLSTSARDYYHHMGKDCRDSYHNSMMRSRHSRQTSVDHVSPSTTRDVLPEYGYLPSRNASLSVPDPTQFEPRSRQPPQAPLPRFLGTLPAPHGVLMHAHHYLEQHMVPQIPITVTASGTKLYHCRYTNAVGCEKTFTTSGHASRHSKIHTCEKGIQCAFAGCPKKFTRADNMKQHLETHKDSRRLRPSSSGAGSSSRRVLRKNASVSAVAMRREGRGLTHDMVRLQARHMREVNTKKGNEALV